MVSIAIPGPWIFDLLIHGDIGGGASTPVHWRSSFKTGTPTISLGVSFFEFFLNGALMAFLA